MRKPFSKNPRARGRKGVRAAGKWMVLLWAAVAAPGQPNAQMDALREAATRAAAQWETLAKSLDAKIARMLPCDPRLTGAIEEVSAASQSRLNAMNLYLQAVVAEARQDSAAARAALSAEQAAARDLDTDRAEADQERQAVNAQLSDLTESARHKPSLEDARASLQKIAEKTAARVTAIQLEQTHSTELIASLTGVAQATEARQHAVEAQLAALVLETSRWGDYYAARLARARTECDITNPNRAGRRKQ